MREHYNREIHNIKRQNQELKNAYDMSLRDYKLACEARSHAQGQLNIVKTEMDSLKVGLRNTKSNLADRFWRDLVKRRQGFIAILLLYWHCQT